MKWLNILGNNYRNLFIVLCTGAFVIVYLLKNFHHPAIQPLVIKKGNLLFIPEGSSLRDLLKVKRVEYGDKNYPLVFPAEIQVNPKNLLNIYPPLVGKINSIISDIGDDVSSGQMLANIFSADLAQIYGDWLKARSAKILAEEQLNRIKEVQKVGASAIKEVEMAQSNFEKALAEYQKISLKLRIFTNENVTESNGLLNIRSPINGKVMNIFAAEGSFINDLNKPILAIANLDSVWVTFCVREDLIQFIKKGQEVIVTLDAYPKIKYKSNILLMKPLIDMKTRCSWLVAELINNEQHLQPNMFAEVTVNVKKKATIMVPKSAVLMNNEKQTIFVELKPWLFKRQLVRTGFESRKLVEIIHGLDTTHSIVASGGIYINDQ